MKIFLILGVCLFSVFVGGQVTASEDIFTYKVCVLAKWDAETSMNCTDMQLADFATVEDRMQMRAAQARMTLLGKEDEGERREPGHFPRWYESSYERMLKALVENHHSLTIRASHISSQIVYVVKSDRKSRTPDPSERWAWGRDLLIKSQHRTY